MRTPKEHAGHNWVIVKKWRNVSDTQSWAEYECRTSKTVQGCGRHMRSSLTSELSGALSGRWLW